MPALRHHPTSLKGPAQQDLLLDVLLSALYGRHLSLRKTALAQNWLCCRAHWLHGRRRHGQGQPAFDTPQCKCRRHPATDDMQHALLQIGQLPMTPTAQGVVIQTPNLSILAAKGQLIRAGYNPCANCAHWVGNETHAIHCLGKFEKCLDVTQCACLRRVPASSLVEPIPAQCC